MEPSDWIAVAALVVALGSFGVACIALRRTSRHNDQMRQYASATPDISLMTQINQARLTLTNIGLKMAEIRKGKPEDKLTERELDQIIGLETVYSQAAETLHSSFNLACTLYRDGSVNQERFRRQYEVSIRELFEKGMPGDNERLLSITSPYKALQAVYHEWFNREK
jgi:hypothetical protein